MEFNRFFSDQKYMNEMRPVFSKGRFIVIRQKIM